MNKKTTKQAKPEADKPELIDVTSVKPEGITSLIPLFLEQGKVKFGVEQAEWEVIPSSVSNDTKQGKALMAFIEACLRKAQDPPKAAIDAMKTFMVEIVEIMNYAARFDDSDGKGWPIGLGRNATIVIPPTESDEDKAERDKVLALAKRHGFAVGSHVINVSSAKRQFLLYAGMTGTSLSEVLTALKESNQAPNSTQAFTAGADSNVPSSVTRYLAKYQVACFLRFMSDKALSDDGKAVDSKGKVHGVGRFAIPAPFGGGVSLKLAEADEEILEALDF